MIAKIVLTWFIIVFCYIHSHRQEVNAYPHYSPEIEKAIKEASTESRQRVIESLINGGVCEKLLSYKHGHASEDKMTSYCKHLLGKIMKK